MTATATATSNDDKVSTNERGALAAATANHLIVHLGDVCGASTTANTVVQVPTSTTFSAAVPTTGTAIFRFITTFAAYIDVDGLALRQSSATSGIAA